MNDDGYLLVHYHGLNEPERFDFADHRSWQWDSEHEVLIIRREKSRTEIPKTSVRKLDCVYNTLNVDLKDLEKFANGEHSGPVHPTGD